MTDKEIHDPTKYPDFTGIESYVLNKKVPIGVKLFGSPIVWQKKEDGENTGIYLDDFGDIQVRSRNTKKVADDIRQRFLNLPCAQPVRDMLVKVKQANPDAEVVLFGEMLLKGKSPKQIDLRDETRFIAFDLMVSTIKRDPPFMKWPMFKSLCVTYGIPVIQFVEETTVNSLDELMVVRERLLAKCRENRWEGVVGKVYIDNDHGSFINIVKEKTEIPKVKAPEDPANQLPELPDSEITGAIEKALFEMGQAEFSDTKTAMPKIAALVRDQCVKHKCRPPGDRTYRLYRERLMRL
jgi:hypothetical protein